ncbi:group II intron maturase-specific domain-containing protein [Desulfobacter sp.]|uniref:group II intron maturase-specific domain-containing protein n=1 Tax=Desulfobacter sp. TaxID=2294 RepID=UPI003D0CDBC9
MCRKNCSAVQETQCGYGEGPLTDGYIDEINYATQGWSAYFHYQHSTEVMARVKWFTEERVRKHLCVRYKVRTRTNGYKRFSTEPRISCLFF